MWRPVRHLSVAVALALAAGATLPPPIAAAAAPAQSPGLATFVVLLRGVRIGTEIVDVSKTESGWMISSTGQLRPPFDIRTTRFELSYGNDWQPRQLAIEAFVRGQLLMLTTTFGLTTATSDMMQGGQKGSNTRQVTARTVVLPGNFFAAYEALAARLATAEVGARFPVFLAPDGEISAVVTRITARRIVSPDSASELRHFDMRFNYPNGATDVEVWTDSRNRLARVVMPATGLSVIRDDLSSVMTREETIRHPTDADVFIPAAGFNLAATVTRPKGVAGRAPAIVLVAGAGSQDRDETRYGVPIFGQLSGALADRGFFVVRYDKRGVGQSGGRTENATLDLYAEDVVAIVNWLRRQKDVDAERIAVVGHAEGGAVALLAAGRERRIRAVGLVGSAGKPGRDVTLDQQQQALGATTDTDTARAAKLDLQRRINEAVITGRGWESIPPTMREQAESAWFRSWLLYDPAAALARVRQPVLIIHGALDRQFAVANADLLEQTARARRNSTPAQTQKVIIPGINHLLIPARTGAVDEYTTLESRTVSPDVAAAIAQWLQAALPARK